MDDADRRIDDLVDGRAGVPARDALVEIAELTVGVMVRAASRQEAAGLEAAYRKHVGAIEELCNRLSLEADPPPESLRGWLKGLGDLNRLKAFQIRRLAQDRVDPVLDALERDSPPSA